jgi:hypothetical protein
MIERYFYLLVLDGAQPSNWDPFEKVPMGALKSALVNAPRIKKLPKMIKVVLSLSLPGEADVLSDNMSQVFGVVIDGKTFVDKNLDKRKVYRERLELAIARIIKQNAALSHVGFSAIALMNTHDDVEYDEVVKEVEAIVAGPTFKDYPTRYCVVKTHEYLQGQLQLELSRCANKAPFLFM